MNSIIFKIKNFFEIPKIITYSYKELETFTDKEIFSLLRKSINKDLSISRGTGDLCLYILIERHYKHGMD